MKFRTEYEVKRVEGMISVRRPVILVGSCFSDNICRKMRGSLWKAINPGGALYNPMSVARAVELLLLEDNVASFSDSLLSRPDSGQGESKVVGECGYRILERRTGVAGELWHSMLFDSSFSGRSREEAVGKFLVRKRESMYAMRSGADLIVTFGTARAYFINPGGGLPDCAGDGYPVGNCHKFPTSCFVRRLLDIDEIVDKWTALIRRLHERFGDFNILFTVSPIRHLRDGMEGNSLSKAMLRVAIDRIISSVGGIRCGYFPAFEIMTDDLRDYRFYASDMTHPSDMAVDYIWEKFRTTYISGSENELLQEGNKVVKAMEHRSIIPPTDEESRAWRERVMMRYESLRLRWPECLDLRPDMVKSDPLFDSLV